MTGHVLCAMFSHAARQTSQHKKTSISPPFQPHFHLNKYLHMSGHLLTWVPVERRSCAGRDQTEIPAPLKRIAF